MDIAEHVICLERSAPIGWIRADPDAYLNYYATNATYFDPFREKRADGLEFAGGSDARCDVAIHGAALRLIDPAVQVDGNVALLTFNLVKDGKPSGSAEETGLARWNATEVYRGSIERGESSTPTGRSPNRDSLSTAMTSKPLPRRSAITATSLAGQQL